MILVAGFNTAIDRRIDLDQLRPGSVQRARSARALPGGKGLHVAQTVAALGEAAGLVGVGDAAHARMFADHLHARGVAWHEVRAPHDLRVCCAIHEADGRVTEILESGPELDASLREDLLASVRRLIPGCGALVLSGSLPQGFPDTTYADLVAEANAHDVPCLVDASGALLEKAIPARPWLVKPNADEATALTGRPVRSVEDAIACAVQLHARGAARVVVTLGSRGAVGFDGERAWCVQPPRVEVRNAVGSGDCFMAGLAVGAACGEAFDESLRRAAACGAANAAGEETGYATPERVAQCLEGVVVVAVSAAPDNTQSVETDRRPLR